MPAPEIDPKSLEILAVKAVKVDPKVCIKTQAHGFEPREIPIADICFTREP